MRGGYWSCASAQGWRALHIVLQVWLVGQVLGSKRAEQEHCLVKWLMVQKHCVLTVDGEALCPFMGALSPKRGL